MATTKCGEQSESCLGKLNLGQRVRQCAFDLVERLNLARLLRKQSASHRLKKWYRFFEASLSEKQKSQPQPRGTMAIGGFVRRRCTFDQRAMRRGFCDALAIQGFGQLLVPDLVCQSSRIGKNAAPLKEVLGPAQLALSLAKLGRTLEQSMLEEDLDRLILHFSGLRLKRSPQRLEPSDVGRRQRIAQTG